MPHRRLRFSPSPAAQAGMSLLEIIIVLVLIGMVLTLVGSRVLGGADKGKAIIVLNPAEPPLMMRDTVYVLSEMASQEAIAASIAEMVAAVQAYVPGYRLKQQVQFEVIPEDNPVNLPGVGRFSGLKTAVYLEVEGAAHYLPAYAGNLDIMTSAALATAEQMAGAMNSAAGATA